MKALLPVFASVIMTATTGLAVAQPSSINSITVPPCENCFTVLDIKPRSACEKTKDGFSTVSNFVNTLRSGLETSESFTASTVFNKKLKGNEETIRLGCTSPLTGNLIYSVKRSLSFGKIEDTPLVSATVDQVIAKNGQPIINQKAGPGMILQFTRDKNGAAVQNSNGFNPDGDSTAAKAGVTATATYVLYFCNNDRARVCRIETTTIDDELSELDKTQSMDWNKRINDQAAEAARLETEQRNKSAAPVPDL